MNQNDDDLDKIGGLMPRRSRDYDYPLSRDWKHIDCKAVGCKYNYNESCSVPSRANLNEEAKCSGFEAKELNKKIDGD